MPQTSTPRPADVHVEDVEVRGHIVDSLILPKILDCIMSSGGHLPLQGNHDRPGPHRSELTRGSRFAPSNDELLDQVLRADCRPRGHAGRRRRLPIGRGRHRRGLSRRILQHHEPADGGAARRQVGRRWKIRRWTAASWSIGARRRPLHADERSVASATRSCGPGRACGSFPRSGRARRETVRVHEQRRLDRETEGTGHPREIARELAENRRAGGKTLIVAGPAVVHTGSGECLQADDSHGLRRRAVRRQRPGHARHRAGAVRHQPGRVSR